MPEPVFFVGPGHWRPLVDALLAHGWDANTGVYSLLGAKPSYNWYGPWLAGEQHFSALKQTLHLSWAGAVDLEKTVCAVAGDAAEVRGALEAAVGALREQLGSAIVLGQLFEQVMRDKGIKAMIVGCSYDPTGRTAVLAAQRAGVPVIHVTHGCQSAAPQDAWYAARDPGDVLCVPGQRDVAWWQECLRAHAEQRGTPAQVDIRVTGHPLWDGYATLQRRGQPRVPVVLWACESGANAAQTPAIWASREVPTHAWGKFLAASKGMPWQVVLKGRVGEDGYRRQDWETEARQVLGEQRVTYTDAAPEEVLPDVDVVVCQDSNLGVEALMLGSPVVSITRAGGGLFEPDGSVVVLRGGDSWFGAADLRYSIEQLIKYPPAPAVLKEEAAHYNRGVDGLAMARVVGVIEEVAGRA